MSARAWKWRRAKPVPGLSAQRCDVHPCWGCQRVLRKEGRLRIEQRARERRACAATGCVYSTSWRCDRCRRDRKTVLARAGRRLSKHRRGKAARRNRRTP